jgi:hypothetical protein
MPRSHSATKKEASFGDAEPIGRAAIFRIASITKPIVGVAAMLLIEDDAMALDDHVARWITELAHPRVLRMLESELGDMVPADGPITDASGSLVSTLGDLWAFASMARRDGGDAWSMIRLTALR